MGVQIILAASKECEEKALADGYVKQTILIKHNGDITNEENKRLREAEMFKLRPYQFLVSSFWGMGPD